MCLCLWWLMPFVSFVVSVVVECLSMCCRLPRIVAVPFRVSLVCMCMRFVVCVIVPVVACVWFPTLLCVAMCVCFVVRVCWCVMRLYYVDVFHVGVYNLRVVVVVWFGLCLLCCCVCCRVLCRVCVVVAVRFVVVVIYAVVLWFVVCVLLFVWVCVCAGVVLVCVFHV